ncbi:MAG: LacI family DNA-binding transcriptional regulator [Planctomycetota bacterium]
MPKPVTSIHAIAKRLGVAASTVSRALNEHPAISEEMRMRVLRTCRELRFNPRGLTPAVGIVMPTEHLSMRQGYHSVMLASLTGAFARRGMAIELINEKALARAEELRIGAVVGAVYGDAIAALSEVPNLPVFTLNLPLRKHGIHSAIVDHKQGAVIATEHLIEMGHRRIAFLECGRNGWGATERRRGFLKAMKRAKLDADEEDCFYRGGEGELYDILRRIHQAGYTAILVLDEAATLEAPHILTNVMNLTIPKDISLLCIEAYSAHAYLTPPQTVIYQPLDDLVEATADAVITCMTEGEPKAPLDIRLPSRLILRESVKRFSS